MATGGFNVVRQQTDTNRKENDNELYLELKNKMKVKLINHGNVSTKISVALDIHIGSFSDPKHFPGLAYLCQQMLISGNNTRSNRFRELVDKYCGEISLTISSDHTTYYFHINTTKESVLEEILHRFAQIFISLPTFEEIEGKIIEMDSKLKTELQDNWFKYFERSTVTSAHPYSNYGLGKKKILTEMSIQKIKFEMLNFIMKYYSANIMTLCIASSYAPDKIKEMIARIFSEIENSKFEIPKFYEDPFENKLRTKWYITSRSDAENLRLSFPLPKLEKEFWHMATNCISFFLECNNKKSLLDTLKAKNWCNNISTSACREAKELNFFHVIITLLPEGYSHINDIILLFFNYLKLFKIKYLQSDNGRAQLLEVLKNMLKYGRFEKEEQAFTKQSIVKMVQQLHKYTIEYILSHPCLGEFNYTIVYIIKLLIDVYISPDKIRVYIIINDLTSLQLEQNWENVDYIVCNIQKSVINRWTKLEEQSGLHLPDLKCVLDPNTPLYSETIPTVIMDTLFIQLWYAHATPQSSVIQQQTKMFFHFISPHVYENPLNNALNFIFGKLVKDAINRLELLKDELQLQVQRTNYGILLEVTGYVPITYYGHLSCIIDNIINMKVVPEQFETLKNNYVKTLKSFASIQPLEQAYCYLSSLLSEKSWTYDEVLKASAYITIGKMQEFIHKFVNDVYVKCFIYGEIGKPQALEIGNILGINVREASKGSSGSTNMRTRLLRHREIKLESGTHVLYEAENKVHDVSCTLVYYQIGKQMTTMELNSNVALLYYIMAERAPKYFDNIQHIRKVCMNVRVVDGIQGLQIVIEAILDPYIIEYHIEQFILSTMNYIRRLSTAKFEKYKTDLIRHYEKIKSNNLSYVLWVQVSTKLYLCDQHQKTVKFIQDIKQKSLYMLYKEKMCENSATLSVHVSPQSEENDQSELSSDKSNAPNKPESKISVEINKPLVSIVASKVLLSVSNRMRAIKSTLNMYEKIEKRCNTEEWYRSLETRFKKIDGIMLFKQAQNYYDL